MLRDIIRSQNALIRDKPISTGSPWQNAYAERLIGSIRRECVDHVIVLDETHLRRILAKYAAYYDEARTHRSLNKDARFGKEQGIFSSGQGIQISILFRAQFGSVTIQDFCCG
jgi:transposase InsO family protein